jgi:hypothetical protein
MTTIAAIHAPTDNPAGKPALNRKSIVTVEV